MKDPAVTVMAELGIVLSIHTIKTLWDIPDARNDDVVTVCDSAAETCPVDPGRTTRRRYPFVDPSGGREVPPSYQDSPAVIPA
ncbi:hypothetical protein GCM10008960_20440 [Deinococcus sedimenti]|uniref:Arsenate reductase n=1 Tax=Deinococcus sedimenti TaxID=1867090 RepID=A0ABQ2S3N9_9DEIO|nr:hypothetical protein GCM10008960_20440 [Deinococcus sedimenti]